ncbi:hypothetical protein PsorP6_018059 [Peronosclerospora sorghi]|uniref:Uncharacterized protein n=1 Tax=Peronosclerospora sorghi TaxID=230839 RepID=A0ACC0WCU6_9STRA|nr:hypothetical protein PsorP6_018059 [Peronosclerospora sorghi]
MGFLAFLTCGACASRRKKQSHYNFAETITIPTPSTHHDQVYNILEAADAPPTRQEARQDRRHSTPRSRASTGPHRPSNGPTRPSTGPHRPSNGPTRPSTGPHRTSGASHARPRPSARPEPHSREPRPVHPRPPHHDRLMVRGGLEPVGPPEKVRPKHGGAGGPRRDRETPDESREVAHRVLEQLLVDPTLGDCRIPYASLYFTRVLSKGAFGEVWLAQFENRQVAVKRILQEKKNDEKEIECFAAEIKLMACFSHPKIVEFLGVSWNASQDVCAVTEYMGRGDLYGFLKRRRGQLNWRDHKIFLAEDVADALAYLHGLSPMVIHRDLKSKNILLDESFRAKLSDFGISRERSVEDTMTAGVGTIYWTAPEVLMGKKYTEKADIFSFGIVMSELDTQAVPYADKRDGAGKKLQGMKIVQMVIRRNLRPTFSPECPSLVKELVDRCLHLDPDVRPSAMELLRIIQRMENLL